MARADNDYGVDIVSLNEQVDVRPYKYQARTSTPMPLRTVSHRTFTLIH